MTPADACAQARVLLAAAEEVGTTEIELPWQVYYGLQDIDAANIEPRNQWNRWLDPELLRDKLDRMEGKVVARVTKTLIGEDVKNGME